MRSGFSRRSAAIGVGLGVGCVATIALIACSRVLGIEPAHERLADGGGSPPVIEDPTEELDGALPPLGEKDAACGDTTSDPKNCGECGRDCRGGKCESGRCEPSVFVFGLTQPGALAVTDEGVYWTDRSETGSALRRCDLDGCPNGLPRTLFDAAGAIYPVVTVQDDYVYALRHDRTGIDTCRRLGCGGSPSRLSVPAIAVAAAPQKTYYVTPVTSSSAQPGVWRCSPPYCSGRTNLHPKGHAVHLIGADLYVLDQGATQVGDGTVIRCPGGNCASATTLASGLTYAWPKFVASSQGVGWIARSGPASYLLLCEPKSCAGGPRILAQVGGYIDSFAFDDTYLYWVNNEYSVVERVAWKSSNGPPEVLLRKQGLPTGIAMHDGALYFSRSEFGDIVRYVPPP